MKINYKLQIIHFPRENLLFTSLESQLPLDKSSGVYKKVEKKLKENIILEPYQYKTTDMLTCGPDRPADCPTDES